jgi:hypothetical protein
MRFYYNSRSQSRGYSTGIGGYYLQTFFQLTWFLLVIGFVVLAVGAVLAAGLVLGAVGCLWWSAGWLFERRPAWADRGRRMRKESRSLFVTTWRRRREENVAAKRRAGTDQARQARESWLAGPPPVLRLPDRFTQT